MRNRRRDPIKSVQRRLQIEAILAEYPALPPDQLLDLIHWFKREATAMEVATVACNPAVRAKYRHFRGKYLAKLTVGELILATGLGMVLIVTIAAVIAMP